MSIFNKQKQIEEMAKELCHAPTCEVKKNGGTCYKYCKSYIYAFRAINAGYRKQSEGEWIGVDESLPEPNKLVLCIWEREDDSWNYGFARYQRENVWYVSNEGMPRVTHWMPLPMPPKGDEGK